MGDNFLWDLFLSGYIVSAPISCKVNKTVTPTVYVVWKNHFCFERSTVQKQPSTSVLQINFSDIFKKTGKMVIPTTVQKQQLGCLESTLHVNALKCCWNLKIKTSHWRHVFEKFVLQFYTQPNKHLLVQIRQ